MENCCALRITGIFFSSLLFTFTLCWMQIPHNHNNGEHHLKFQRKITKNRKNHNKCVQIAKSIFWMAEQFRCTNGFLIRKKEKSTPHTFRVTAICMLLWHQFVSFLESIEDSFYMQLYQMEIYFEFFYFSNKSMALEWWWKIRLISSGCVSPFTSELKSCKIEGCVHTACVFLCLQFHLISSHLVFLTCHLIWCCDYNKFLLSHISEPVQFETINSMLI